MLLNQTFPNIALSIVRRMPSLVFMLLVFYSSQVRGERLLDVLVGAQRQIGVTTYYDGSYRRIAYPGGDVAPERGVCTDVIIRAYRHTGIDLQRLVHEDMRRAWHAYPRLWGLTRPDTNIDHRRVPNLAKFFQRHGEVLVISTNPADYQPGDLVTWRLDSNLPHIGIVSTKSTGKRPWIIHNIGAGVREEDVLFHFTITGHYRYLPKN